MKIRQNKIFIQERPKGFIVGGNSDFVADGCSVLF